MNPNPAYEQISVFDMLKIGIGPSSSHTLGPWRAAGQFLHELTDVAEIEQVASVRIHLYGSLALTGRGHGSMIALLMGLSGADPVTVPLAEVENIPNRIQQEKLIWLHGKRPIPFDPSTNILFHYTEKLDKHANGMIFEAYANDNHLLYQATYYSIGGGFVLSENRQTETDPVNLPFPVSGGKELLRHCEEQGSTIAEIVRKNELAWRSEEEVRDGLKAIWQVMKESLYRGCHTGGILPGGLHVTRRASEIIKKILPDTDYPDADQWIHGVKACHPSFSSVLKMVGAFAMAVNEENAAFGRIVTAPTNGAAGVIPAVLMYFICFSEKEVTDDDIERFLMVAAEIGSIFKKGSTISAAMGGCQAEIGVSSAMAASALTEGLGGSPAQALMAAEIAMEHHLGLTCDPIAGLVQVPCIERNSMGAVKAITAAHVALDGDPSKAKVSLDDVVKTMWETAKDMSSKYKETSQGGLAVNIAITQPEC